MPVIKSAIKKLRKDIKRTKANAAFKHELEMALRGAKKTKSAKTVSEAVSFVDRAVKNNLMHKNRAARIKSSLSKLAKPATKVAKSATKANSKVSAKVAKTTVKKPAKKSK